MHSLIRQRHTEGTRCSCLMAPLLLFVGAEECYWHGVSHVTSHATSHATSLVTLYDRLQEDAWQVASIMKTAVDFDRSESDLHFYFQEIAMQLYHVARVRRLLLQTALALDNPVGTPRYDLLEAQLRVGQKVLEENMQRVQISLMRDYLISELIVNSQLLMGSHYIVTYAGKGWRKRGVE